MLLVSSSCHGVVILGRELKFERVGEKRSVFFVEAEFICNFVQLKKDIAELKIKNIESHT